MRLPIMMLICLSLYGLRTFALAADAPSFEAASVKPASPSSPPVACSGGPGTASPGIWRCTNMPLGRLIALAYGFMRYQFSPNGPCCQDRFEFIARVPEGTTQEQFHQMIQALLEARLKLKLHREPKEMAIYELTVGEKGSKVKKSAADVSSEPEAPWETPSHITIGKDGYPVFPAGQAGLTGVNGLYRWTGFNLSMQEITRTLSFYLGRPVVDATGLKGKYDIDLKWGIDVALVLEMAGRREELAELPEAGPAGPNIIHAVQDQLGLKLNSKKGLGDVVIIDHVEKIPSEN